jgi:hypothetical protein
MKPVLTFFFDALKPESLPHMPFLNSFTHKRRMRTELGYSVTCHPTMYSGVHPDKHRQWFVWKFDPKSSPFAWARPFRYAGFLDTLPTRYFLHKYTRQFREKNTAWFGVPLLVNLPLKYWPLFDVVEDRSWDEPGYLKDYQTIFDLLRRAGVAFEVVGMTRGGGDEFAQIGQYRFGEIKPWTYFFLGSLDSFSHRYGQGAAVTRDHMRRLDQLIEAKYGEYAQKVPDFDVFVFSDHGHIPVEKRLDIHHHFRQHGRSLNTFINLIEANYARFWFRTDKERAIVERILCTLEEGFALTPEHLRRYHLEMPDSAYGDLVFYLDRPAVFTKTIWGFSRHQKSMHGYLPDYAESDGIFLSQRPLAEGTHVELVDMLPTLLDALGLPIPDYVDGRPVWAGHSEESRLKV